MKKTLLLIAITLMTNSLLACDVCGSGTGTSYMGLLPDFKKKFAGIRYQYSSLKNHLGAGGNPTYLTATERFSTVELWGAANIGKKFRVSLFAPYHFISRENQEGRMQTNGIGDITAVGFYKVFAKEKQFARNILAHTLWLGAGIKLPSGSYNPEDKNIQEAGVNTFQLGTGSTDFSLHLTYDIRLDRTGLNINTGYKINTTNRYQYQYGDKLTVNSLFYYQLTPGKKIELTPNAGVLYERAGKDLKTADISVWETGGHSLMGVVGVEVKAGGLNMGLNFQSPVSQNLGEGKAKAKNKGMIYVAIPF